MKSVLKAIIGSLVAGLGSLATALSDNGVTKQEWVTIIAAAIVALGSVYRVPNKES